MVGGIRAFFKDDHGSTMIQCCFRGQHDTNLPGRNGISSDNLNAISMVLKGDRMTGSTGWTENWLGVHSIFTLIYYEIIQ